MCFVLVIIPTPQAAQRLSTAGGEGWHCSHQPCSIPNPMVTWYTPHLSRVATTREDRDAGNLVHAIIPSLLCSTKLQKLCAATKWQLHLDTSLC